MESSNILEQTTQLFEKMKINAYPEVVCISCQKATIKYKVNMVNICSANGKEHGICTSCASEIVEQENTFSCCVPGCEGGKTPQDNVSAALQHAQEQAMTHNAIEEQLNEVNEPKDIGEFIVQLASKLVSELQKHNDKDSVPQCPTHQGFPLTLLAKQCSFNEKCPDFQFYQLNKRCPPRFICHFYHTYQQVQKMSELYKMTPEKILGRYFRQAKTFTLKKAEMPKGLINKKINEGYCNVCTECIGFTQDAFVERLQKQQRRIIPRGGYNAPFRGGYNAPFRGGYNAPFRGGYNAPFRGGYNGPSRGDRRYN